MIPDQNTYRLFREGLFKPLPAGGGEIIDVMRESGVPHPYIYFPQTLGMLLGRALHANPEWLYMLGRIFNLVFYAFCIWLSVKIAPIGKGVLALVALYPMAVELAASLNSDVYTIALAFLAFAQYLRIAYTEGTAKWRDLLLMLLTMGLLGPPKVIFIPLMMLAFFLPARCFNTRKAAILFRAITAAACVATTFFALFAYIHRADGGVPIVTLVGTEVYGIEGLLADPVLFAKTCKRSLSLVRLEFYYHSLIGSGLGALEIYINKIAVNAFMALSVLAAFKAGATEQSLLRRDRFQYILVFFFAALGTAAIMFVSWTPVGSWDIIGVQGRYFLPVWPLFILFAARWGKPVRPGFLSDRKLVAAACCLHVYVLVSAYLTISGRGGVAI
jgi:uncharacterized membrane protein